jgi:hypothetical protein
LFALKNQKINDEAFPAFDNKQNYFSNALLSPADAVKTADNCVFVIFIIAPGDNLRRD